MRNGEWANQTLNFLLLIARALPRGKSWSVLSHLCPSPLNTGLYLSWAFLFFLTSSGEERIANNIRSQRPRRSPLKARKSKDLLPFFFLNTCLGGHFKKILSVCTGRYVWYKLWVRKKQVVCTGLYPTVENYSVICMFDDTVFLFLLPPLCSIPPPFLPCFWWSNSHDCPAGESIRTPLVFGAGQVPIVQLSGVFISLGPCPPKVIAPPQLLGPPESPSLVENHCWFI